MRLTVLCSNNDPSIVCRKFLDEIISVGVVPRKVIADRRTKNVLVASMQRFLHRNDHELSGGIDATFQYGKSISNQRFEAFWSQLRRSCTDWWIRYFRQLVDIGEYDITENVQVECMKFVCMRLIQQELDQIKM